MTPADGFVELVFKKQFDVGIRQVQFSHDESLLVAATDTFSGESKDFANPSAHFRAYRLADGVQVAGPAKTDSPPGFDPTLAVNVGTGDPYEFVITTEGTVFAPTGGPVYTPQRAFEPSRALRFSLTPPDPDVPPPARKTLLDITVDNAIPIPTPNLLINLGNNLIVARYGHSCATWMELESAERSDKVNIAGQFCGLPEASAGQIFIEKVSVSPKSDLLAIAYNDQSKEYRNYIVVYDIKNRLAVYRIATYGDVKEMTFLSNGVVFKTQRPSRLHSSDQTKWSDIPTDKIRISFADFSKGTLKLSFTSLLQDNDWIYLAFTRCAMISNDLAAAKPFLEGNASKLSGKSRRSGKPVISPKRGLFTIIMDQKTVSVFRISEKICSQHMR